MAHGVEPRSKQTQGLMSIPKDPCKLQSWWQHQTDWPHALNTCVAIRRMDAILVAAQCIEHWQGKHWTPTHKMARWIHGRLCRAPGVEMAASMQSLAPCLVGAGGVGDDGFLRAGLLVDATRADRVDLVEWMASLPQNRTMTPSIWPHVAHIAAANGSLKCLDLAISRNVLAIEHCNDKGRTLLHVAAGHGQHAVLSRLLQDGADANRRDCNGRTPLAALMMGHREVSGWKNNTLGNGWQAMALMLIQKGDGPEQHYGKTPRSGSLVERVRREIDPAVADELSQMGRVHSLNTAMLANTALAEEDARARARF